MPPYFEYFNNNQKLTIVSFISSFHQNHFMQIVGHRVPLAQII